jgi:hypothetical protein
MLSSQNNAFGDLVRWTPPVWLLVKETIAPYGLPLSDFLADHFRSKKDCRTDAFFFPATERSTEELACKLFERMLQDWSTGGASKRARRSCHQKASSRTRERSHNIGSQINEITNVVVQCVGLLNEKLTIA